MISFDVTVADDGETRCLRVEGTDTVVGWIEFGRRLTNQYGTQRREMRFVPADPTVPAGKVHTDGISGPYDDARAYAEARL